MSGGGTAGGNDFGSSPIVHQIALLLSIVAITVGWRLGSRSIQLDDHFAKD